MAPVTKKKRMSWSRYHKFGLTLMISFGFLNFATGMGVVYLKHESRQLYSELQRYDKQREALQVEWSQLLLEQGAWATDARVERIATERLNMKVPTANEISVIKG
jgi:cell division protein FtsL